MAPALSVRNVRGSMTPLLQYGLVNLMNAALILLQVNINTNIEQF